MKARALLSLLLTIVTRLLPNSVAADEAKVESVSPHDVAKVVWTRKENGLGQLLAIWRTASKEVFLENYEIRRQNLGLGNFPERNLLWLGDGFLLTEQPAGLAVLDAKNASFLLNDVVETWSKNSDNTAWAYIVYRGRNDWNDSVGRILYQPTHDPQVSVISKPLPDRAVSPIYFLRKKQQFAYVGITKDAATQLDIVDINTLTNISSDRIKVDFPNSTLLRVFVCVAVFERHLNLGRGVRVERA